MTIELFSPYGGLADLSKITEAQAAELPPPLCELFKRLRAAQKRLNDLKAEQAAGMQTIAECDRQTDEIIAQKQKLFPKPSAIEALRAVQAATAPKF